MALPQLDDKQLSTFRRYFLEVALICLAVCVAALFRLYIASNDKIQELQTTFTNYMVKDKGETLNAINAQTGTLNDIKNILLTQNNKQ